MNEKKAQVLRFQLTLMACLGLLVMTACDGCRELFFNQDVDAGDLDPFIGRDGGMNQDDEPTEVEPCDEDTEGIGSSCSNIIGAPLCGQYVCCAQGLPGCDGFTQFICLDPGPNACGVCGELDESNGVLGRACGEFGCGQYVCSPDGTATVCEGDHPHNPCGGCLTLTELESDGDGGAVFEDGGSEPDLGLDAGIEDDTEIADIGSACSLCETGTWTCGEDRESVFCVGGRASDNRCGSCERCIIAEAYMDDRFDGGYVLTGTRAVIEDIGQNQIAISFDPLLEGPGADALSQSELVLTNGAMGVDEVRLSVIPFFASSALDIPADPARLYILDGSVVLSDFEVLRIVDLRLGAVISEGRLIFGEGE